MTSLLQLEPTFGALQSYVYYQ